jgi:hypothetical protein
MLNRLPKPQAILQVYAVIAVMLSAWTITAFLWKLSAWLLILNVGELFTVFSYVIVTNLVESLIALLLLLVVCVMLPPQLFREHFVVRGAILSIGFLSALMVFVKLDMQFGVESRTLLLIGPLAMLMLTGVLLSFSSKIRFLHSAILWISDRLVVFLYILVPLFAFLFAYVLLRNIT